LFCNEKEIQKNTVTAWSHTSYFFTALARDHTWVTAMDLN